MRNFVDTARYLLGGSFARVICFFIFWLILYGVKSTDLLVGVAAAIVATWASGRLLPPGRGILHPIRLIRLVLYFPVQSIVAGFDVARRALDPRLPLQPGFVVYKSRLSSGPMRNVFCTITGLLPGTLPSGSDQDGNLVVHCLDVSQQVIEQLSAEEAMLRQVLGGTSNE